MKSLKLVLVILVVHGHVNAAESTTPAMAEFSDGSNPNVRSSSIKPGPSIKNKLGEDNSNHIANEDRHSYQRNYYKCNEWLQNFFDQDKMVKIGFDGKLSPLDNASQNYNASADGKTVSATYRVAHPKDRSLSSSIYYDV